MARLPDETVTLIKQEVSLVRLVEARGFELKPHGSHYAIHCPFHADDKIPSLIITPEKNLFHCWFDPVSMTPTALKSPSDT